jgi:hypothetical protein
MQTAQATGDELVIVALTHDETSAIEDALTQTVRILDFMSFPVPAETDVLHHKFQMAHAAFHAGE